MMNFGRLIVVALIGYLTYQLYVQQQENERLKKLLANPSSSQTRPLVQPPLPSAPMDPLLGGDPAEAARLKAEEIARIKGDEAAAKARQIMHEQLLHSQKRDTRATVPARHGDSR